MDQARHRDNLAVALRERHAARGERADLLRAVQEHRHALDLVLAAMPAEAAQAAVAARRPTDAVVALETGRALLLVEALADRPRPSADGYPIGRSTHDRRSGRLAR